MSRSVARLACGLLTPVPSRVALIVQIHLEQNRTDLALKEVSAARRWAQDSMLINLAESWVGLRVVRLHGASRRCRPTRSDASRRVENATNRRSTSSRN